MKDDRDKEWQDSGREWAEASRKAERYHALADLAFWAYLAFCAAFALTALARSITNH